MENNWSQLTQEEKREQRFKRWSSPEGVNFSTPKAKKSYQDKVKRFIDVIQLREPDRVPVYMDLGVFPARYSGITPQSVVYDAEKLVAAWSKIPQDFDLDAYYSPGIIPPGAAMETMDYKLYRWPGHGVSPNQSYQFAEAEYMKADEYDDLIRDPSDWWYRTYMPRIFGAWGPLGKVGPITNFVEIPFVGSGLAIYGNPEVKAALQTLMKAGDEAAKWAAIIGKNARWALESGFPSFSGGMCKAPFDTIGDTLRGTQGIMKDMYRQPEKLVEACERFVPIEIKRGVTMVNGSGVPIAMMPLHKGADGFMSQKQFDKFYWPSFRKVVMGLIEEGITPLLFAEGGYNSRLEAIKDLPKGKVIWHFDQTDMQKAKQALDGSACIMGNIPSSILFSAPVKDVKEHCKRLIEVAGKGGGYILANGAVLDDGKPENVQAVIQAAHEYGVYKK